ncbi:arabinogalactan O-methyltransferase 2 [Henckelia pumila]|uniref:arabinogalactan O-methyltransferase 2 n=1 Tax=Henckelia pumila TaxID=405737 RepID=UPI003C6E0151
MNTNPSPPLPPMHKSECSSLSLICRKNISHQEDHRKDQLANTGSSSLTAKEMRFLLEFFSRRVPCNLLIFGQEYQYSSIASLNAGGVTIFLEDNLQNTSKLKSTNSTQVYKIMYNTLASEAYKLLKDARNSKDCLPNVHLPKVSKCNLVLSNLPQEVYETTWDVVLVDGPRGDTPDSPGKMTTIYMASILARSGNITSVIVHNVDRMIEKWFSWEFLCEENLCDRSDRLVNDGTYLYSSTRALDGLK